MGYYIHLYPDYLWFKYFMTDISTPTELMKLDGTVVKITPYLFQKAIYNDYGIATKELLNNYNLDLSIFYEEIPDFENIIEEIPMDKISLLVDSAGVVIKNVIENKEYAFTKEDVGQFIEVSTEIIFSEISRMQLCN